MKAAAKELGRLIEIFRKDYSNLNEALTELRISEDKWTLKEIIGHLIDSASNNHQRFVRLKQSNELNFPDYKNTEWLHIQNHNNMKFSDLLSLFYFYNRLLMDIISNIDEESLNHRWNISWGDSSFITLESLAKHYVEHIKMHLTHFSERLNEVESL